MPSLTIDKSHHPYADLPDEEVFLRCLIFWAMKTGHVNQIIPVTEYLTGKSKLLDKLITTMFKRTAMRVFFGGETLEETEKRCEQLLQKGAGVIIDYAAPENISGLTPDHFSREVPAKYKNVIDTAARLQEEFPESPVSIAIKLSTLGDYEELKKISAMISEGSNDSLLKKQYETLQARFEDIISHANKQHIRAYVDAELTEINPLIRKLCYDATDKDLPVSMTLQCYLKETPSVIDEILQHEKKPSIKLVRGAYMGTKYQAERPYIWDTKQETDDCYNKSFTKLYGKVPGLTVASHNQQSLTHADDIVARGRSNYTATSAATLLGMGAGLEVVEMPQLKYVPFPGKGSVLGAISYFGRRGTEFAKSAVAEGLTRGEAEYRLAKEELNRRKLLPAFSKFIQNILLKDEFPEHNTRGT